MRSTCNNLEWHVCYIQTFLSDNDQILHRHDESSNYEWAALAAVCTDMMAGAKYSSEHSKASEHKGCAHSWPDAAQPWPYAHARQTHSMMRPFKTIEIEGRGTQLAGESTFVTLCSRNAHTFITRAFWSIKMEVMCTQLAGPFFFVIWCLFSVRTSWWEPTKELLWNGCEHSWLGTSRS